MQKPITTEVAPPELGRWAATLEAALRPQIRTLIESILDEEVEQTQIKRSRHLEPRINPNRRKSETGKVVHHRG